jgi:hypothetical protein
MDYFKVMSRFELAELCKKEEERLGDANRVEVVFDVVYSSKSGQIFRKSFADIAKDNGLEKKVGVFVNYDVNGYYHPDECGVRFVGTLVDEFLCGTPSAESSCHSCRMRHICDVAGE